jgi:hypothetical protein
MSGNFPHHNIEWGVSMECLKCGHRIPDKDDKCLYCGAWTRGEVPSETKTEPSQFVTASEKTGNRFAAVQVTKEETKYKKLEDLPESLRAKVAEMLRKGERQNGEIKTSFHNFFEPLDRKSSKKKKPGFLEALKILLKKE